MTSRSHLYLFLFLNFNPWFRQLAFQNVAKTQKMIYYYNFIINLIIHLSSENNSECNSHLYLQKNCFELSIFIIIKIRKNLLFELFKYI